MIHGIAIYYFPVNSGDRFSTKA
ncbi:uncharacterized protein METZ01_LOCUS438814, partial [marine metagenome]